MSDPQRSSPRSPQLLTLSEVSEILRCARPTALGMIQRGELRGFQIGGRRQWRVDETDLTAYIDEQKCKPLLAPTRPVLPTSASTQ